MRARETSMATALLSMLVLLASGAAHAKQVGGHTTSSDAEELGGPEWTLRFSVTLILPRGR